MIEVAVALSLLSVASLLLCALLLPVLIVRMPEDYFDRSRRRPPWRERSTPQKLLSVARSLLGAGFVVAGIAMLVLPGQGLLTILMGIVIADFPRKFQLEQRLVRRPGIRNTLDRIRTRFGKPPLRIPDRRGDAGNVTPVVGAP